MSEISLSCPRCCSSLFYPPAEVFRWRTLILAGFPPTCPPPTHCHTSPPTRRPISFSTRFNQEYPHPPLNEEPLMSFPKANSTPDRRSRPKIEGPLRSTGTFGGTLSSKDPAGHNVAPTLFVWRVFTYFTFKCKHVSVLQLSSPNREGKKKASEDSGTRRG